MFSVAKDFEGEQGQKIQLHVLVEADGLTLTRHVDDRLVDKMKFSVTEAHEMLNLMSIATENIWSTD